MAAVSPQNPTKAAIPGSLSLSSTLPGNLVAAGWTQAQSYASNAVGSANNFLNTITNQAALVASIPVLTDSLAAATKSIGAYVAPALPTRPTALATIDAAFTATAPTAPTLTAVVIPAAPADVGLPSVPTLASVSVPAAVLLSLPAFSAVLPGSPSTIGNSFSFLETGYTSTLLTALRARLEEWVNGASTGLAPAVEQALWDRARAREVVNASLKGLEAMRAFAMRGFAKPPGMLAIELAAAAQAAQDANSTASRDIAIKQAELEQANRKFAFEQAFKLETGLISYASQVAQRGFEAARYAQQVALDIYQHDIGRYSADVQAYNAKVEQWKGATQAELTKLEKYKADLEGQRLVGTVNEQAVQVYTAQIQAAKTIIELYRSKVDATNAVAAANKAQVESYAAQVGAYGEYFRARAAQYGALTDVYGKDVQAFTAQVQGQTGRMGAEAEAFHSEVQYNQAAANVRVEVAKGNIANLTEKMRLLIDAAKGGAQVSAQMAASALSSINLSGSVSEGRSVSESLAHGESNSYSYGWTSSATDSTSAGTSTNTNIAG